MKNYSKFLILMLILNTVIWAQDDRSGLMIGIDYMQTQHTNPYVTFDGDRVNPVNLQGFDDKSSHIYLPFAWQHFSQKGFSEFSTNAWHLLAVGLYHLINSSVENKSWAQGYVPVLQDISNDQFEASFLQSDLFRMAFAGRIIESLPLLAGLQGGVGNFGIHFSDLHDSGKPTDANNDGPGLVNFNEAVDLYYGVNTGLAMAFSGNRPMVLSVQYDWHFFIKGTYKDEYQKKGNRIRVELTYFPFDENSPYKDVFFTGFYIHNNVPYMKQFNEKMSVDYSNSTLGIGLRYFIL